MKRLTLLVVGVVLFVSVACAITGDDVAKLPKAERIVIVGQIAITYWHDSDHQVSCWIFQSAGSGLVNTSTAGISCLPDSEVNR